MKGSARLLGCALSVLLALSACRTYPDYAADFHFPVDKGDPARDREAFVGHGCPQCHTVAGVELADYQGQPVIKMPLGGAVTFAKTYGDSSPRSSIPTT
jgi:hypothetical protein